MVGNQQPTVETEKKKDYSPHKARRERIHKVLRVIYIYIYNSFMLILIMLAKHPFI